MELCVTPHTGCGTSLRFSLSLSLSPPLPICVLARTHSCTLSLSLKKKEKMSEEQQNKYRARVGLVLGFGGLDFPCFLSNRAFTRMWKLSVCFLMWYLDRSSPIVGLNTYFNLRNLVWEALLSPFSWWGNWSTGKEKKKSLSPNHWVQSQRAWDPESSVASKIPLIFFPLLLSSSTYGWIWFMMYPKRILKGDKCGATSQCWGIGN